MADHAHDAHHSEAHYVKIWFVLLILLAISIAGPEVAGTMDPSIGLWVMLITAFGIAFVKAWLVIKHFMHLTDEAPFVHYILILALTFLVLFFAGVAPDVKNHEGTNWSNEAAKAETARVLALYVEGEPGKLVEGAHEGHGTTEVPNAEEPAPAPAVAVAAPKAWADMKSDGQKKSWLMKRGAEVYGTTGACVTCHRSSGLGHGPYPTLLGQKDHMGDCATTLNIIKNGLSGPIMVNGAEFTQPMPPVALSAEDAAAVATYVRNSWGNDYGICAP